MSRWEEADHYIRQHLLAKSRAEDLEKQRQELRVRRQELRRKVHLARTNAEIRLLGKLGNSPPPIEAQLVLNEITPSGLYVFLREPLAVGQRLSLTLTAPTKLFVRGTVLGCLLFHASGAVIRSQAFPYRARIQFDLESERDREAVQGYCQELSVGLGAQAKLIGV